VGPEAALAGLAVDHRVAEALEVPARLPDPRVHEHRGLDPEDVAAEVDDVAPPEVADVPLELDPERPVVPRRPQPAVDLARLEHEPAALAEADQGLHVDHTAEPTTGGSAPPGQPD